MPRTRTPRLAPRIARRAGLVLLLVAASAETCSISTDSDRRNRTATIEVLTVTTGTNPDPDGYTVELRGPLDERTSASIGLNDSVTFADLSTDTEFTIELQDVASNCDVRAPNPVEIFVEDEATVRTTFGVECGSG